MSIVVDLIIIGIILLSVFLAYRKGLILLAVGLVSFLIAIVVTVVLYRPIANLVINVTGIDEAIENSIYEQANDMLKQDNEQVGMIVDAAKNEMLPQTARTLAVNIVTGGVFLVLFVAVKVALIFVKALAKLVAKLPIIKQLDKTGGIIYGLLRGFLIVYVALFIISIAGNINPNNSVHKEVENSALVKVMYENNILNVFFDKI